MATSDTQTLLALIEKRHQCLTQLVSLAGKQDALIERNEMVGLLDLLAAKDRWLTALAQIEQQLDPFRDQAPEARRWDSPELRSKCGQLVAQCEQMVAVLMQHEQQGLEQMQRRRDDAAQMLKAAHTAGQARAAYATAAPRDPGGLDLTTEG